MAVHASNNPFSCSSAQVDGEALDNLIEETVAEQGNQAYTQKGGYPGTTAGLKQELEDQIYSISFESVQSYDTLADLQAVTPIPANNTTAKVAKDTVNPENNGNWYVSGGAWVQFDNVVENVVEETNTTKGVTGKAVVTELEPYINNSKYLTNIDNAEDFYTVFNGVDAEINLGTPITLSDDGDSLEFTFYVEDLGTSVSNSLSLGFIGQVGLVNSLIGFNNTGALYVRSNSGAWLSTNGLLTPKVINTPYTIKLVWGTSDIKTYLDGFFQKSITKGDFTIANIGHAYNWFKGGCLGLTIVKSGITTIIDNVNLIEDANIENTGILRKPNTILKIADDFDATNTDKAVSGKQVFENTISSEYLLESSNLINPKLIVKGYYSASGTFYDNSNNWISITKSKVEPSTEYTLSGCGGIGSGGRVVFLDSFNNVISVIEQIADLSPITFTTPSNCVNIGVTIANDSNIGLNPQDNVYVNTLMLNLGNTALPFETFEPKINGNKVDLDLDSTSNSNYYEFNLTANSGQPQFTVYVPIGGDRYIGYKLALQYDMSDAVYSDIWRIYNAKLYRLIDDAMADQSIELIISGESEFVYKTNGTSDHTGGVHGDETLIDVGFYADGYEISIASNISLTKCESFYYIQNSNLHTTDDLTHTIESEHYKKTTFSNRGYTTRNRIKTLIDITFTHIYHGISCIAKTCANKGHNELNMKADFTGTTSNFLTSKAREFNAYNVSNSLSVFVTSELKNPIISDYDCEMFVWDRATDSKYYRKYVPSGVTPTGTLIECEMEVKFDYK